MSVPLKDASYSRGSESSSDSQAVVNSIRKIVHALEVGSRAAQKGLGLSGAQLLVLQTLASSRQMSVTDLAAKSYTHQSSVSVVVSRLVQAKFVKRVPSAGDARRVELIVTPLGCRLLKKDFTTPQQRLFDSLGRLHPKRLAQLRVLLHDLVSLSGMDSGTPPMFFERIKGQLKKPSSPVASLSKNRRK